MNNLLVRDVKYLDEQYRIGEGIISDNAFKQLEKLFIPVDPEPDYFNQKNNNELHKSRLIAIFQPHRYSRTKQFNKEFAEELSKADVIYVTSIYAAGEANEDKITSKIITDLIYKQNKNVSYINNYHEITNNFYKLTQKGDLILNMGAGDCHNFWSILNKKTIQILN